MAHLHLLLTQLLVILAVSRAAGGVFRALGQPRVVGEMAAGIALGPSILGVVAPGMFTAIFPAAHMLPLATLSQLGVILFMFTVGLRLDCTFLRGNVRAAVLISHSSILCPFVLGAALAVGLHADFGPGGVGLLPFALFLGVAMSVTAFPVLARILAERQLIGTPLGVLAITCAAVDDVTAWCLLAAVLGAASAGADAVPRTLVGTAVYVAFILFVQRGLQQWMVKRLGAHPGAADAHGLAVATTVAIGSALATEWIGVHALFGAFLAGLVMPRVNGFAADVADCLQGIVGVLLLPVFFTFTGLRTNAQLLSTPGLWAVFAGVLAVAVAGKVGGSAVAARITGIRWSAALVIGILMNTRGLMEVVILNVGLDIGVISPSLFAVMVLMALVTTACTSPLLNIVARLQRGSSPGDLRHVASCAGQLGTSSGTEAPTTASATRAHLTNL